MNRPTGTVTFLFTDIEGSTEHWEKNPGAMERAFKLQEQIIRGAAAQHNGYVYKMIGDAFQIAFATARDALEAAVDAQRLLCAENWAEIGGLRVRMALHTGVTEERGDDYVGPVSNRVARLMSTGYGGQILLSDATQSLVRDHTAPDITVRDLGEVRLKDLERAEHVYQIVLPDLPSDFPPLKSFETPSNNLPLQLTSFVGREKEIAEAKRLLTATRLLTLTGAGGCGKTRLALQVVADLYDPSRGPSLYFKHGIWFVDLASLSDPDVVPQAIASAIGFRNASPRPMLDALKDHLKEKNILLVMDNCEHLIEASTRAADTLLHHCPGVKILATSREALAIGGETAFRVPSLTCPDPGLASFPDPQSLNQYEAVRLFEERALSTQPTFTLTNANARAVVEICRRLDGIPLAIELAAARIKTLKPGEIAARLDDSFRLLTGGSRNAPTRQQTLRAAIDWSYDLLSETERKLLRRLAVFSGGATLLAVEEVCAGDGIAKEEILDLLTHLIDKSLLLADESGEVSRYKLLETIRQYARERLLESTESDNVHNRHLATYVRLAEEIEPQMRGPHVADCLNRLDLELGNIRGALGWSLKGAEAESGLRLAAALMTFWSYRSLFSEGHEWLGKALTQTVHLGRTAARARGLAADGCINYTGPGDLAAGRRQLEESIVIWRELGPAGEQGLGFSLVNLGRAILWQKDIPTARAVTEEAAAIFKEIHFEHGLAGALENLGEIALRAGDEAGAATVWAESLEIAKRLKDEVVIAAVLEDLARLAMRQGDLSAARARSEEGIPLYRKLGDKYHLAQALRNLGEVDRLEGNYPQALEFYRQSLALQLDVNLNRMHLRTMLRLAGTFRQQGRLEQAARLLGAIAAGEETITFFDNAEPETSAVRRAMGKEAFAAAWAQGRAMTMAQAIDYALAQPVSSPAVERARYPADLTEREVEVLRWLARGLSNQEIADKLVLSRRTVHAHLRSIFGKLDVTTRSAATRVAIENKIV